MDRLERVNSSFDLEYDYYKKNLPPLEKSVDTEESIDLYEKIFESRKTFTILGLDSYIVINKKSLSKIADMINAHPQEYVLFTEHQIVDEDKFDKMLEKERDKLNPIIIAEPENENDIKEGFKNTGGMDDLIPDDDNFKICFWLYLFLILCAICNFLIIIYTAKNNFDFTFYTYFSFFLFGFLLFTGIFGFLKSRAHDFSNGLLKIVTFSVPVCGSIGIITFFAISSIPYKVFWMKIVVDAITILIGIMLIICLSGLIKRKKKYDIKNEGLLKSEEGEGEI